MVKKTSAGVFSFLTKHVCFDMLWFGVPSRMGGFLKSSDVFKNPKGTVHHSLAQVLVCLKKNTELHLASYATYKSAEGRSLGFRA